jgi:hypothetical protein
MSGLGLKTDMGGSRCDVCDGPDASELARTFFTRAALVSAAIAIGLYRRTYEPLEARE